ncbi:MAG: RadC family protein [Oscillospiraceae bacterium]|nr:RadC family protein [Oscillospiraceae bacterium]
MADHRHDGHRSRMRERFLKSNLYSFQPHEMLEMLLFHAIPRSDTNPVGHALLDRFGSLHGVLSAEPTALRSVPGMTDNAVVMILFLRQFYAEAVSEHFTGRPVDSFGAAKAFFQQIYAFEANEVLRVLFLDESLCIRRMATLREGFQNAVSVPVRQVSELCFAEHSRTIVLAHNHPGCTCAPSAEDIAVTRHLVKVLRGMEIDLTDHIIVGSDGARSLREDGIFLGLD